jgi:hypothetical protein
MAIRIAVSEFELINRAGPRLSDGFPCHASIAGAEVRKFSTRIENNDYEYPKLDGRPDETDAVKWLDAVGWQATERVGEGEGPNHDDESTQPAGFRNRGYFDSLHVEYFTPVSCACENGGKITRYFRMNIDYDRSSNSGPEIRVEETKEDRSPAPPPPDRQLRPKVMPQREREVNGRTFYDVVVEVSAFVPCPCSVNNPCETAFVLKYTYRPEVVP